MKIIKAKGKDITPYKEPLAKLRIKVFREYPYLYDGDIEYEQKYLSTYAEYDSNLCLIVFDQQQIVGASTGMWLKHADSAFQACFHQREINIQDIFYFGESLLLSEYRGKGLGRAFFNLREQHALSLGANKTCFCVVDRQNRQPPDTYRSPEPLWRKLGYSPDPNLKTICQWKEIDEPEESGKPMMFWLKNWFIEEM